MGRVRDKAASIQWAKDVAASDDWVILDTSSTGFTDSAVITQVGVIDSSGATLLDTLVKPPPRKRITDRDLSEIGVDKETLKSAPDYSEIKAQIEKVVGDRTVHSYNKDFRQRVFRQTAERVNDDPPRILWGDCVMERYSRFVGEWRKGGEEYKWQKLPKSASEKGAIGDCLAIVDLIRKMADEPIPETKARKRKGDEAEQASGCLSVIVIFVVVVLVVVGLKSV